MNESKIKELIVNNSMFQYFVSNQSASIEFVIKNVPVVIYKEESGTSFYYKVPYDKNYDYACIVEFMKIAIPVLNKMIDEERTNHLMK